MGCQTVKLPRCKWTICRLLIVLLVTGSASLAHAIERAKPESVGLNARVLNGLQNDLWVAQQMRYARDLSIAVVKDGKLVYSRSVGNARENTLFDVASLTKPIATASAIMKLVEEGLVRLDEPIVTYIPDFANCRFAWEILDGNRPYRHAVKDEASPQTQYVAPIVSIVEPSEIFSFLAPPENTEPPTLEFLASGVEPKPDFWMVANDRGEVSREWMRHYCEPKQKITVEMLLRHRSGLRDLVAGRHIEQALKDGVNPYLLFAEAPGKGVPRYDYLYADINFVLLRMVIDSVLARQGLVAETWIAEKVFRPLGMKDTTFKPSKEQLQRLMRSVSPTIKDSPRLGQAHDPIAQFTGGYTGNAGLFTTAIDLASFAAQIGKETFPLRPETVDLMRGGESWLDTGECIEGPARGLGWDIDSPFSEAAKGKFESGIGHTGYTGTSIWIDPELDVSVILLSNRLYYRGYAGERVSRKGIMTLRRTVAERVLNAFVTPPSVTK